MVTMMSVVDEHRGSIGTFRIIRRPGHFRILSIVITPVHVSGGYRRPYCHFYPSFYCHGIPLSLPLEKRIYCRIRWFDL